MSRGIDISRWKTYSHILTESLWLFDERDSDEKLDFHGAFIPQIARQLIERYTQEGDTVLDLFIGSGTTFKVASKLNRQCIGVDISAYAGSIPDGCIFIQGDSTSTQILPKIREFTDSVQLVICHPPYHDIIKFGDDPRDLSNISLEHFIENMNTLAIVVEEILDKKGFCALVMGDKYAQGEVVPLGFYCMREFHKWFKLKGIVIKNIENNEAKGKNGNLWRYWALKSGFFTFKHEYVFIFKK